MFLLMLHKKRACVYLGLMTTTQEEHRHGCRSAARSRGIASVRPEDLPLPGLWQAGLAQADAHPPRPRHRLLRDPDPRNHRRRIPRPLFVLQDLPVADRRDRTSCGVQQPGPRGGHRPSAREFQRELSTMRALSLKLLEEKRLVA